MIERLQRNPLTPWYIGIAILVVTDVIFAYYIFTGNCGMPNPIVVGFLFVLPGVYLALMYLTFKSQA
jgi:hypothetical protein